jgi:hypothetical protein
MRLKPEMQWPLPIVGVLAVLLLQGCGPHATPPAQPPAAVATAEPPLKLVASIQDIMATMVDPSADALWASVGSTVTAEGTKDNQPRTDAEWLAARHQALVLAEAPNLLVTPGRAVAEGNRPVEDAQVPGILSAAEIQQKIEADPAAFARHARALQDAGLAALAAVEAKNPVALLDAGEKIDGACETCHLKYWYPNSPKPKAPPS